MSRVQVVSDTTHYMPREMVERFDLRQVALYVNWQGRTDRETDLPDFGAYYEHLVTAQDMPTTSQPSVGDFLAAFRPILEAGDDIVSIHLSGAISGTVRSAEQARDQLVEEGVDAGRVAVVDSETACGPLGLVLVAAARAAQRGAGLADVVAAARAMRDGLTFWFAVDTLEFLRRGGRIGAAQAYVGAALKVKPILTLGKEITPVDRVRTSSRAFDRLVEHLRDRRQEGCDGFVVQHVRDHERAGRLADAGREIYGGEAVFVSEIGPVIGTHVGPGLLGVSGFRTGPLGAD